MEKYRNILLFIILNPTPDFPHFYYMLGGNLGSLLYGDVSVMEKKCRLASWSNHGTVRDLLVNRLVRCSSCRSNSLMFWTTAEIDIPSKHFKSQSCYLLNFPMGTSCVILCYLLLVWVSVLFTFRVSRWSLIQFRRSTANNYHFQLPVFILLNNSGRYFHICFHIDGIHQPSHSKTSCFHPIFCSFCENNSWQ